MSTFPRISVFITSYNQKDLLVEAIDSVLAQTLQPMEILICDDASTDGSRALIQQYTAAHPQLIRPILHEKNLGIAPNKADAQRKCRGDWITYLDGDDRYLPGKLEREWQALSRSPEAKIAFSNFYFMDEAGRRTGQWAAENIPMATDDLFRAVYARDFPGRVIFRNEMIARECLDSVGYYNEVRRTHEDWDLKIRLARRYAAVYVPQPGVEYRRHEDGISTQMREAMRLREVVAVYRENLSLLEGLGGDKKSAITTALDEHLCKRVERLVYLESRNGSPVRSLRYMAEFRRWLTRAAVMKVLLPSTWHRRLVGDVQ